MSTISFLGINRITESKILNFLNLAQNADAISSTVQDNPQSGTPGKGYDIGQLVAQRIFDKRAQLPNQRFTSITQLADIKGLGQDKLNDLVYSFYTSSQEVHFIRPENWSLIQSSLEATLSPDDREAIQPVLHQYQQTASILDILAQDARDFNRGDNLAGQRLILQLNNLIQFFPSNGFSTPPSDENPGVTPISGFIPNPILPGFRHPCFFLPVFFGDLFLSLERLRLLQPNLNEEITYHYLRSVDRLIHTLAPVEILFNAANQYLNSPNNEVAYFQQVANTFPVWRQFSRPNTQNSQPINRSTTLIDLPFPPLPGNNRPILDFCQIERWARTEAATLCFRRLRALAPFEIEDIINLDRGEISRRGCAMDRIVIKGTHLGNRGELSLGRLEVTPESWSPSAIEFIVPPGANADRINLCINPGISECTGFSYACKIAASGTDYSFEVVVDPQIESFAVSGPTAVRIEDDRYEAEACTALQLNFDAREAERVTIQDNAGNIIWDSGLDSPRRIDTSSFSEPIVLRELQEDVTYTLEVSNLCRTIQREITLSIYHAIHISAPSRIRMGETGVIDARISCPAPEEGVPLMLTSSIRDALQLPSDPVLIASGETRTSFEFTAGSLCAETVFSADAPNHRLDTATILIFDTPVITSFNPPSSLACANFTLAIEGDCFDPEVAGNSLVLSKDGFNRVVNLDTIRFLDTGNRGHQAILEANISRLLPGEWTLRVTSHGINSESFIMPLLIRAVSGVIHDFRSSSYFITPCISNRVNLNWDISQAERIEIRNGGTILHSESYANPCDRYTDSTTITLTEATTLRLLVYPAGGGEPTEQSLNINEFAIPQASELRIENRTQGRLFPEHTLTIWVLNQTDGRVTNEGTISPGESVTISLNDCKLYNIYAVSHEWVRDYNRFWGTAHSPSDSVTINYPRMHKDTIINLLGRSRAGLLSRRIEPGG